MDSFLIKKIAIRVEVLRIFFESYKEIVIICIKKSMGLLIDMSVNRNLLFIPL